MGITREKVLKKTLLGKIAALGKAHVKTNFVIYFT